MEFIGCTRTVNGKEQDIFVLACPEHNYIYNRRPPLTIGCKECWTCYFLGQFAESGAKYESVEQLEAAIHHAAELAEKGLWDFKPDYKFEIEKDAN